jgi:GNAT superfamily N-acetyltransferase
MWNIREATDQDTAAIALLITQLGYETTEDEMRNRMQRIGADTQYVSLVASNEKSVMGFLGLAFGLYYECNGIYARIVALSVAPESQGEGVGRKLIAAAEKIAKTRGAITFIVNSGLQRAEAHIFYEGLGFLWKSKAFYEALGTAEQAIAADRADRPRSG